MAPRFVGLAWCLVLAVLPLASGGLFASFTDDEGCSFKWGSLGCMPSPACKLDFKLRLGSFGPCVRREKTAAAAEPVATEPAAAAGEPAAADPAAAEPAAAEPAAEAAAEETATEEAPADSTPPKDEP